MSDPKHPYVVRFFQDGDELVGARWWNEAYTQAPGIIGRRVLAYGIGGAVLAVFVASMIGDDDEDLPSVMDALELQRREGWNVGETDGALALPYARATDAAGGRNFATAMMNLVEALAPADPRLLPFYVPTLFQSVAQPASRSLRDGLLPMLTPSMETTSRKAESLGALLDDVKVPGEVALVLDLPGPDSVAAAAALADRLSPVFVFDNWPHPRGVVPAHETLAATLHHLPTFLRARQNRPANAPPLFVLDASRLRPYVDDASQFDNRYVARLPSADALARLGIRRVLYVRPAGATLEELDDLNQDFVDYRERGLEVKLVSLGDFGAFTDAQAGITREYWGGSPHTHVHFWPSYGWYQPVRTSWAPAPRVGGRAPAPPPPPSVAYQPVARPTLFSNRTVGGLAGVGKQRPSGFGVVSVRTNRRTGAVTGVVNRRSGSFGRSRSSYSG